MLQTKTVTHDFSCGSHSSHGRSTNLRLCNAIHHVSDPNGSRRAISQPSFDGLSLSIDVFCPCVLRWFPWMENHAYLKSPNGLAQTHMLSFWNICLYVHNYICVCTYLVLVLAMIPMHQPTLGSVDICWGGSFTHLQMWENVNCQWQIANPSLLIPSQLYPSLTAVHPPFHLEILIRYWYMVYMI